MKPPIQPVRTAVDWPPEAGQLISFRTDEGWKTGFVKEVRWGLVWRDFILEDARVIPEHKVEGCPQPPPRRNVSDVTQDEREFWEERLVSMAESGLDPHEREQSFWAELNQYLAYTYLRFKQPGHQVPNAEHRLGT